MNLVVSIRRMQETALVAVSCFVAAAFLSGCSNPPEGFADLFVSAPQQGLSAQTMSGIVKTQDALATAPQDEKLPYALAYLYLQAVRENADTDFYDRTEALLQRLEDHGISGPEHQFLRGLIAMAKHDFESAVKLGSPLVRQNPHVQRYYGLLADALTELGQYDEAIATLQAMADIDPNASVMTRIAYAREIHGDRDGAKEAMETAIEQGGYPENVAWELCEMARLELQSDPAKANFLYDKALFSYADYPPALAGKARVAMAMNKPKDALAFAQKAFTLQPLPDYAALVGDIMQVSGDAAGAKRHYTLVTLGYEALAKDGTNVELEQARFLVEHGLELPTALQSAMKLYEERGTIYVADTLAWAQYQSKQYTEAAETMQDALATDTHDPLILFHAGMIAKANGDAENAKKYLELVKKESPYFSFLHAEELEEALKKL
jgi:tetratricopeptide (TPR) repeat protein